MKNMSKKKQPEKIIKDNGSLKIKKGKKSDLDKFNEKHVALKNVNVNNDKNKIGDTIRIIVILLLIVCVIVLGMNIYHESLKDGDNKYIINEESYLNDSLKLLEHKDDYIGKVVVVSGIYETYTKDDKLYKMIYRKTPGNGGNNGIVAFDISYTGDMELNTNDYIKVTGILQTNNDNEDDDYLIIKASKIEKLESLNEFVYK